MAKTVIGKVGMTPKGSYSNATQYKRLDVVTCNGCSYVCLQDCVGIAVTNTNYWQLMAEKGRYTEQDREDFKQAVVQESKNEMDTYTNTKKTEIDTYVEDYEDDLKSSLDSYEETKETELNNMASNNITTFNNNATTKTTEFNANATNKTNTFNTNVTNKTTEFNTNAETKTTNFNSNATEKTTEYNTNANAKVEEYDANATAKIAEYDAHVEELQTEINNLKETVDSELETAVVEGTAIDITDSAKADGSIITKGRTEQKQLNGYNLIDTSAFTDRTINGITFTRKNDGSILINGTSTAMVKFQIPVDFIIPAGDYTIFAPRDANTESLTIALGYDEAISETILQPSKSQQHCINITFNQDTAINQLRFYINAERNINNYLLQWMLVKGTYTEDTIPGYEPYCGGQESPNLKYPQKIKVVTGDNTVYCAGKNILNCNLFENNTFVDIVEKSNGKLKLSGHNSYYVGATLRLNLKPNTNYSFRAKVTELGTNTQGKLLVVNQNYALNGSIAQTNRIAVSDGVTEPGDLIVNFTTDSSGIVGILLQVNNATNSGTITYADIQLEEGVATSYEPARIQEFSLNLGDMELCQIGDSEDVLFKNEKTSKYYNAELEENAWYKKKNINKKIFDGTETFYYISGNGYFALNKTATGLNGKADDIVICTHFRFANSYDVQEGIRSGNNYYLQFIDKDITEANAFKNILAQEYEKGTPVTVYYLAMNPTYEKITNQTLIAQLEAIHKLRTEHGVNHIWTEAQELEPNLEVTYKKSKKLEDENKFAEMQAEIDELKALVIESNS